MTIFSVSISIVLTWMSISIGIQQCYAEDTLDFYERFLQANQNSNHGTDEKPKRRPHFLMIHADDLGHHDIGYNNPEVISPYLDKLAAEGVILTNNYYHSMCSPSRAALHTGMYSHHTSMNHGVLASDYAHCLPTNIPLLPELLRDAGYQTHMAGKWNLGYCQWNCTPTFRGYDSFTGFYGGAADHYTHIITNEDGYDWRDGQNVAYWEEGVNEEDIVRDRALRIIEEYDEGDPPLYLWLAFHNPHDPLQAPREYLDLYPEVQDEDRKTLLAMVTYLDDAIKAVMEALMAKGLWEDTFLYFSSDNGAAFYPYASSWPYRGCKMSAYEGGTRVPGFVASPLLTKTAYEHDGLFHAVDVLPTFLSMAGVDNVDLSYIDGVDQSDMLLHGGESNRDEIIYIIDQDDGDGFYYNGEAAIRIGDMKLIWGMPGWADGYGTSCTTLSRFQYWLNFINVTTDQVDDMNQYTYLGEISEAVGIKGITRDQKDRGHVFLFNLKDDPNEINDLSKDPEHASTVSMLKDRVLDIIEFDYLPPSPLAFTRTDEISLVSDPTQYPFNAYTPGWCDWRNLTIDYWNY